jgi:hypothetical protein
MPLFGQNPRKFGRNKDIDFTRMVSQDYPVHAVIGVNKEALEMRSRAAACHASQGGGRPPGRGRGLIGLVNSYFALKSRIFGSKDTFMRAFPLPSGRHKESDLFEGLN